VTYTETELKLRLVDAESLKSLLQFLKEFTHQEPREEMLQTIYYDTPDYRLSKSGLSYRLRHTSSGITATVKADGQSDGGLHRRLEFNASVQAALPDVAPFLDTLVGERLKEALAARELVPVCGTSFSRHILDLSLPDGSETELAVDCGEITAADKKLPLLEIELELKKGSLLALIKMGAELAQKFPLLIELESKLARALALGGIGGQVTPSSQISSSLTVSLLYKLISKHQFFLLEPDQENLRRLKIAARKLTSAVASLETAAEQVLPLTTLLAKEEVDEIYNCLSSGWATPIFLNLWAYLEEV
jgi:inorganic triphosphatase YgiF